MIWLTSDLHLGDPAIVEHGWRPFATVDAMNSTIIEHWNDSVVDSDLVFVLGDVCVGKQSETLPLTEQLRGHKCLVPGNHDPCWMGHSRWALGRRAFEASGWTVLDSQVRVPGVMRLDLVGDALREVGRALHHPVTLCHFPYPGDPTDNGRYPEHRPADNGDLLLHGHVHSAWRENGRQVNVGVDAWEFGPVSLGAVNALLTERRCCLAESEA